MAFEMRNVQLTDDKHVKAQRKLQDLNCKQQLKSLSLGNDHCNDDPVLTLACGKQMLIPNVCQGLIHALAVATIPEIQ